MTLPVCLTDRAVQDAAEFRAWWAANRSEEQAARWHEAFEQTIDSLPNRASRCIRARESDRFPIELRQLAFGVGRRRTHRVLFTIRPDMIYVLRIQHLAQRDLAIDDL